MPKIEEELKRMEETGIIESHGADGMVRAHGVRTEK